MSMAIAQPKTLRSEELRPAYTLVELLVVMAALSILAAVTLPSLKSLLHDQKVTSASRMVLAHFQAAQARAIASNSPVSVILERTANVSTPNAVSRLSIGQVFPPYEGDTTGTTGTLGSAGPFYYTLTVNVAEASLLKNEFGVFSSGDSLQLDDRQSIYEVANVDNGLIKFIDPPFVLDKNGDEFAVREEDLRVSSRIGTTAHFRLFRKPTKSFLQTLTLPRGTCVDLSVSGFGPDDNSFATMATGQAMVVFNAQGRIAYWDNGLTGPKAATSLLHMLIGRTEQVALSIAPIDLMKVADSDDSSTFNTNINDASNVWLTVNPFTGAITSSGVQAGDEAGNDLAAFQTRLKTARAFATYGITQSEN